MNSRFYLFVALFVLALLGLSCADMLEPEVGEVIAGVCKNEDTDPDVDVPFKEVVLTHLQMGCGCHNPFMGGSAIDVTGFSVGDYAAIRRGGVMSRDKIVIDGDPCGSYLYQKISEAPPSGSRMPIFGPYWSRAEMAQLHDWIAEGAHEQ
jgi:hypothetical protein